MCLVDFCWFYWLMMETVNYLTGWLALINTESYVLRARCTTESQSCVTDLPTLKCLSAKRLRELKRTGKGTIFKDSLWAVECLQSEGVVECKYLIGKTQHVVNDSLERICGLITFRLFKLIVTTNWPSTNVYCVSNHLLLTWAWTHACPIFIICI